MYVSLMETPADNVPCRQRVVIVENIHQLSTIEAGQPVTSGTCLAYGFAKVIGDGWIPAMLATYHSLSILYTNWPQKFRLLCMGELPEGKSQKPCKKTAQATKNTRKKERKKSRSFMPPGFDSCFEHVSRGRREGRLEGLDVAMDVVDNKFWARVLVGIGRDRYDG